MRDDLDLRGIDQRHEPDPEFRAALRRRIEAILAGADSGSVTETRDRATIQLEPTLARSAPTGLGRRSTHGMLAIVSAAAAVAAIAVVTGRDDGSSSGDTDIARVSGAVSNGWVAIAASGPEDAGYGDDIYLVREGSRSRRITGSDTDVTDETCPAFSPDGTRLAFGQATGNSEDGAALVITDLNADAVRTATTTIALDGMSVPPCGIWSPDGRWVAFGVPTVAQGSNPGIVGEVWVVDTQSHDIRRLSGLSAGDIEWARDPAELAVGGDGVVWYSVQAHELRSLGAAGAHSVAWSPDGRTIAFTRVTGPSSHELWLMDPDGTNERVLVRGIRANHGVGPVWSPDGERIAYQRLCNHPISNPEAPCREQHEVVLVTVTEDDPLHPAGSQVVIPAPQTPGADGPRWWYPFSVTWSPDATALLYLAWSETRSANTLPIGVVAVPLDGQTSPVVLSGDLEPDVHSGWPWVPIQSWGRQPAG